MEPPLVVGLVLAAGQGTRAGGPKALALWGTEPLAVVHARTRQEDCAWTVVVVRDHVAKHLAPWSDVLRLVVSHEREEEGPAGSIAAAVAQGAVADAELVIVSPVDVPPMHAASVQQLVSAVTGNVRAARPVVNGRRGHPVVLRGEELTTRYAKGERPTLRDVLEALGDSCVDVLLADERALGDLNTPEAFQAWTGSSPRFLR